MTGNVPYYGGRFTPAQAYAASHSRPRDPRPASSHRDSRKVLEALAHLLEAGLLSQEEYEQIRARIEP